MLDFEGKFCGGGWMWVNCNEGRWGRSGLIVWIEGMESQ